MNAKVDQELCIGCELCTQTCPSVFEMQGEKASIKANPIPSDSEECAKKAAEDCPVEAISIQE
jgi:ferredoxin